MKINKLAVFAVATIFAGCTFAKAQNYGEVDRVDPAADAIVPANAVVEKLGDGFQFLEGPVWVVPSERSGARRGQRRDLRTRRAHRLAHASVGPEPDRDGRLRPRATLGRPH